MDLPTQWTGEGTTLLLSPELDRAEKETLRKFPLQILLKCLPLIPSQIFDVVCFGLYSSGS